MSRKKILFVSAEKEDLKLTGVEHVILRNLFPNDHKHIECIREPYVSYNDLFKIFESHRENEIEVLHFSGHSGKAGLLFRDDGNAAGLITIEQFKRFISWYPNLKVIILNSCSSRYIGEQLKDIDHLKIILETTETIYEGDAVIFSKLLYGYLNEKDDFKVSFQKTKEQFDEGNLGDDNDRGKKRDLAGDVEIDGDFPWRLSIPDNYEFRFIYPNIADKIRAAFILNPEIDKQLIFGYAENPNVSSDFQKAFKVSGYDQYCDLYMLDDEDLMTLAMPSTQDIFSEDIKVIFIAHSDRILFNNILLKEVFDAGDKFDTFKNLKFSLAVKNGVDLDEALSNTDYFKSKITGYPRFNFSNFTQLCEEAQFEKYINEISVDLSVRKSHIMKFPCHPTRDETRPKDISKFVKIFFASRKNEQLINFIINGIRHYLKYSTPTIISDALNIEGKTLKEALRSAFLNTYDDSSKKDYIFSKVLTEIIEKSHIIVFRINIPDAEQLKKEFRLLLEDLDNIHAVWELLGTPKKPTLIFFLNSELHQINEKPVKAAAEIITLSKPKNVSDAELKKWTEQLRFQDVDFDLILDELENYDLSVFADDCPSKVIELVCDKIKVGKQKILSLS